MCSARVLGRYLVFASDPNPWRLWVGDDPSRPPVATPVPSAGASAGVAAPVACYPRGAWVGGTRRSLARFAAALDRRGARERALREAVEAHAAVLGKRLGI